ncbi:MAG: response regulator [Cellvibrionaceae bacterium]
MSVLIADDDKNIIAALKLLLKSQGLDCTACPPPKEALASLHRQPFRLALVDLNYREDTTSGKEGLQLLSDLQKWH